jgi:hypothetical protein
VLGQGGGSWLAGEIGEHADSFGIVRRAADQTEKAVVQVKNGLRAVRVESRMAGTGSQEFCETAENAPFRSAFITDLFL